MQHPPYTIYRGQPAKDKAIQKVT